MEPASGVDKKKKSVIVGLQFLGGTCFVALARIVRMPDYFAISMVLLCLVAIAVSTHNIAADGLYMASLSTTQQTQYAPFISQRANWAGLD